MVESEDYVDPRLRLPVFSLYGKVRRPTAEMLDAFDVLVVDLQDIGTRIYTFVTTLGYVLEAAAQAGKGARVLDRPNPAGRPVEGTILEAGWESFVGLGPLIMRHGMTLGELALWHVAERKLNVDLQVIAMEGYRPEAPPGYGWPVFELPWVNPSPNAASLNMARCFPGTVLFEGQRSPRGEARLIRWNWSARPTWTLTGYFAVHGATPVNGSRVVWFGLVGSLRRSRSTQASFVPVPKYTRTAQAIGMRSSARTGWGRCS